MADGAIGQNGASVQYHAVEQITPEQGYVIVPLLHTGVLTVLVMYLKLEDATKTLVQVRNTRSEISLSKIMCLTTKSVTSYELCFLIYFSKWWVGRMESMARLSCNLWRWNSRKNSSL